MAVLACAAFAACEQENPVTGDHVDDKDQAYLQIQLVNTPSTNTRGTGGDFVYGLEAENAISTVEFYFYNEDGAFNQHVSKTLTFVAGTANNIEEIANAEVVLKNLKQVGKPKYVVAVLNGAASKYEGFTLEKLQAEIVEDYKTGNYFMMTNSTYQGTETQVEQKGWFATTINAENFLAEKPDPGETLTQENAVKIYVERVAVKVEVAVTNLTNNKVSLGTFDIDGKAKEITLEVKGWGINALNKTSYVEKNVPVWTYDLKGSVANTSWPAANSWSDAANFRSYWAKSPNYGKTGSYPADYAETAPENTIGNQTLTYVSWNNLAKSLGSYDYCLENTNTDAILKTGNFKAKVTHVLLKGQIEFDGANNDLIRYDGRLFTRQKFMERVLGQMNIEAYKVTTSSDATNYAQISVDDIEIVNTYDGTVDVALTAAAKEAIWSSSKDETVSLEASAISGKLDELAIEADYYKAGMMYYCIPIEHLRGGKVSYVNEEKNLAVTVAEADYGVVRNHYYKLTVNDIKNLGTAVYDPDEAIVPNMEIPTYFVGASINILSWKVVNQDVEL